MQTLARPDQHQPDDDLPNIPTLTPLDSAQARRAARQLWEPEMPEWTPALRTWLA